MTNPKEALEWYRSHKKQNEPKTIDEMHAEVKTVFNDWDTLSAKLIGNGFEHDREWPDFPVIGNYVLSLIRKAYEAGRVDHYTDPEQEPYLYGEAYDKGYKEGFEEGKTEKQLAARISSTTWWQTALNQREQIGFDKAAQDPSAWYVLDKNGEQMHIGDKVKYEDRDFEIDGFSKDEIVFVAVNDSLTARYAHANEIEKVPPDTRKEIKEELVITFTDCVTGEIDYEKNFDELAEQFISRIEALDK